MREVVIVDSVRTPLAKSFRGSFNMTKPADLLAHAIKSLLERAPWWKRGSNWPCACCAPLSP